MSTIVARSKQKRTQNVDKKLYTNQDLLRLSTSAWMYSGQMEKAIDSWSVLPVNIVMKPKVKPSSFTI